MKKIKTICILFIVCANYVSSQNNEINDVHLLNGRQLFEKGRTLVHNTVKRFMVILPAVFFKLGIAFTLLILVTIATVSNGIIGFLILVVGMSSLLARVQAFRTPTIPLSYINPIPHHIIDRADETDRIGSTLAYNIYKPQSNLPNMKHNHGYR